MSGAVPFDRPPEPDTRLRDPPIARHGVIGDRRTAALVAADGTLNWLCLPGYDGPTVFGALLDHDRGGYWQIGPLAGGLGSQAYAKHTAILTTRWTAAGATLELTDCMPNPETRRTEGMEHRRLVIRRLRCLDGKTAAAMRIRPADDFQAMGVGSTEGGAEFTGAETRLRVFSSVPLQLTEGGARCEIPLQASEEAWFALSWGGGAVASADEAAALLETTQAYWRDWSGSLTYLSLRREHVLRSAITFHLLSYAPSGALVAAPTASLPERIGGDRNYDYRYAWIRDVSLTLAILSTLGDLESAKSYMDWLSGLDSDNEMPLQVLYRIDGGTCAEQVERDDLAGYRGSTPVRFGNHAVGQYQIDSLGYLADCALVYLQQGGDWRPEYWTMIKALADFTAANWRRPTNGIWELDPPQHYVADKVMAWVTMDRAIKVAEKIGSDADLGGWRDAKDAMFAEVLDKGWSDELQAFRQRYEADTLDASVLLMVTMDFLPADDPRMKATIHRIAEQLTVQGFVYRFDPPAQATPIPLPMGKAEGAFLPCTFWLATAFARLGDIDRAEAMLERVEDIAGELGLFAEEADPATRTFLGNTPLLFSHAEYLKAVMEIAKQRPAGMAGLALGKAVGSVRDLIGSGGPDQDKEESR